MTLTRRGLLAVFTGSLTVGCMGQQSGPNGEQPAGNDTNTSSDTSGGNTTTTTATITQVVETTPPSNTPEASKREAMVQAENGTDTTTTPQPSNSTLFKEVPSEDAVIVARTIITNGCRKRVIEHNYSPPNDYTVSTSRESQDLDGITCQATFEPSPYALKVTFDELESGIDLTVTAFGRGSATYTVTGTQTETIKSNTVDKPEQSLFN